MTIRNWIIFFFKSLLIGGAITGIFGLFIRWNDAFAPYIQNGEYGEFLAALVWMIIVGFTMSVVAQMGFFAYLTVHQFGVGIFRTLRLWNWVQVVIIALVIFDLVFFRFMPSAETNNQLVLYLFLLAVLLITAFITAYFKAKWTNKQAFISALFFMIVVTTLEWLPALMVRENNIDSWVTLLLFPLLAVNAYQLLKLPKYNAKSEADRIRLEERKRLRAETQK
ncbi:KinB-signaling pathway activation protein [Paenisporosarcina cavernae]|uniref:KinB-signaling pathway activation protein n=1 Tax=Paenisporosarcina cavernae TaxID=2320858 RepID=A0A385YYE9_9BACL|nr:KinB-signaling pathway activation protein [Paenisporosarcina cavernae]AYC30573.1 KinB-signaling pathway activation protein [Paenisporosarcina cavernae]